MGWLSPYPQLHTVAAEVIFCYSLLLVMLRLLVAVMVSARRMHVCTAHCSVTFGESSLETSVVNNFRSEIWSTKAMEAVGAAGGGGLSSWLSLELGESSGMFIPCFHRRVVVHLSVLSQSHVGGCKIWL